jgi:hypothetical protein
MREKGTFMILTFPTGGNPDINETPGSIEQPNTNQGVEDPPVPPEKPQEPSTPVEIPIPPSDVPDKITPQQNPPERGYK